MVRPVGYLLLLGSLAGGTTCAAGRDTGTSGEAGRLTPGYVLYAPLLSRTTYLVDRKGSVVHAWEGDLGPGASAYLLDSGHLLRCGREPDAPVFHGGGLGGRIQEFTWDGKLVWDWTLASEERIQHHDIEPLPGGNVLLLAWERKTSREALQAGRKPVHLGEDGLWPEIVLEVEPVRPRGARVVWEWHMWDHLIQDHDGRRAHFGAVGDHPELIDINGDHGREPITEEQLDRLRALGYVTGADAPGDQRADFLHINSVAYNPHLDQILLSVPRYGEIWIIDHGTTTEEAAGHAGGRAGRGGDLIYRWGNPRAHGRGDHEDQRLFRQHDARWIPRGLPGAGNIMIFNNGMDRPGRRFSSVLEIVPPLERDGRYAIGARSAFGPQGPAWAYTAPDRESFYADFISGAHRLPGGNTLITDGPRGRVFEVTPAGETVWEYRNPHTGDAPNPQGDPPYSLFRATFVPAGHPGLRGLDPAR